MAKRFFDIFLKRPFYHFTHHAVIMFGKLYAPVGTDGNAASTGLAFHHVNRANISALQLLKMAGVEGTGGNTIFASRAGIGINTGMTCFRTGNPAQCRCDNFTLP